MEYQKSHSRFLCLTFAALVSIECLVQTQLVLAADPPAEPEKIAVDAESYTDPKPGKYPNIIYPQRERDVGEEGWVFVRTMIDPQGKAYEPEVADSTGNKEFEKRALQAVQSTQFEPATLGGKPVDAEVIVPFYFQLEGYNGVTPDFAKSYNVLITAITAKDQAAAQAELSKIQARNLYENAGLGMAKYLFAKQWGTDEEQLTALRIAVSGMTVPKYLPKDTFVYALRSLFVARVKAKDYVGALSTWKTLQPLEKDPATLAKLRTMVREVEALRTDPRPYSIPATLTNGGWSIRLYRDKFHINVITGHVSQLKLYCEKKYVLFLFDPQLEYQVEKKFGKCSLVVFGDGGTSIELVQKT